MRIEGEHKIYGRIADSGFEIRFHFCPNCGTSVFWEGDRGPTTRGIAIGCIADPNFPAPTLQLGGVDAPVAEAPIGYRALPASPLVTAEEKQRTRR